MHGEHGRCRISPGLTAGWAKGGYIVPCDLLAPILEAHKHELEDEDRHALAHEGQESGWRLLLAERVATNTGRSTPAVFRRLYDVMYGKTKALNIDMAEGMLIAVGLLLDHDTDLPTLPSSMVTARDMAEVNCPELPLDEREDLARSLFHFAQGFVLYDIQEQAVEVVGEFLTYFGSLMGAEAEEAELVAA